MKIRAPVILFALFLGFIPPAEAAPIGGIVPQKVEDRFLPEGDGVKVDGWVENLEIPWSLVFLPDDRALVSERPGRIRDVIIDPDGALYFLTNNRDGRGSPKKGDDKIYRITGE